MPKTGVFMKNKSSVFKLMVVSVMLIIILATLILKQYNDREIVAKKDVMRIGITLYNFRDTFISSVRKEIENYVKTYEKEHGSRLNIEIVDAAGNELTQNRQVERFIALKYDVICINPVDRTLASVMIDKALNNNIPLIFFNREPVEDDMNRSDKLCYVGVEPKKSAILQGEILIDAYKKDKMSLDLNGDGVVKYVLLEGEPSHQDSLIRTEWAIKTIKEGGVPIKKITGGVANWNRSQAAALMETWLKNYGAKIELVISNNDDMALGAIDVIKNDARFKNIKIIGIDGTKPALDAIKKGELLGSVSSDKKEYARAITELAISKAKGSELPENIREKLINKKYYQVRQYQIFNSK